MFEINNLITKAELVHEENFSNDVCFERAVFFSWGCKIGDCTFCYMSTQPKNKKLQETRRSKASVFAEFILSTELGWDIGFFTGGIGILASSELEEMLQIITAITREKIWLSVGPLSKTLLKKYQPYIRGIVGSTETINPILHKRVCPSKPLKPYELMFESARDLNLERAMTFIVGMGETKKDLELLKEFIGKYGISKIHIYGLIPQKQTMFETAKIPSAEEQAWWIANLRITFPKLDIQCGIWQDRLERIPLLLRAGSNSVSKYKATKLFGTKNARELENSCKEANRKFKGTLTKLPDINWDSKINILPINEELKIEIKNKLNQYLKKMRKNQLSDS